MKHFLLYVIVFLFGTGFAYSQKYGYIDSDYILNKMPDYTDAKAQLDRLAERWTKEMEDRYEVIKKKRDNYNREEVLLPNEEKTKRLEEIKQMEQDAMEMQKTRFGVQGDYFQKRQELIKPIQDKVFDAMQQVASRKNFSFIFDKANQSNLVYADGKFDLSDDVIRELGVK